MFTMFNFRMFIGQFAVVGALASLNSYNMSGNHTASQNIFK